MFNTYFRVGGMRWRLAADEGQSCLSDDRFSGRRSQLGDGAG